jgi:hypothetical protein
MTCPLASARGNRTRNGMVYIGLANNVAAQPAAYLSDWTVNMTTQKVDVTALGDTNVTYVAGLPNADGDFTGFYDTATAQTYAAAQDGLSRNFYLYPSLVGAQGANPGQYFFGTILADFTVAGGVSSAVTMKSSWSAASQITRYPSAGIAGT